MKQNIIIMIFLVCSVVYSQDKSDFFKRNKEDQKMQEDYLNVGSRFLVKAEAKVIIKLDIKTEGELDYLKEIIDKAEKEGRLDEVIEVLEKEIDKRPDVISLKITLALAYGRKGLLKKEYEIVKKIEEDVKKKPKIVFNLVLAYGRLSGKRSEANLDILNITTVAEAKKMGDKIWLFLGSEEEAKKWIEKSIEESEWIFAEYLITGALERKLIENAYAQNKLTYIAGKKNEVKVSTVKKLMEGIKNDAVLYIQNGTYDLTLGDKYKNKNISWESDYGWHPIINSISNLKMIGKGDVKLLIEPEKGWVMQFNLCKNVYIESIYFGHKIKQEGCIIGGVVYFTDSHQIEMQKCVVYGCGLIGIQLEGSSDFNFNSSTIKECTEALLNISDSNNIKFSKSNLIKTTSWWPLMSIGSSKDVEFNGCVFSENSGSAMFKLESQIKALNCTFNNNTSDEFINDYSFIELADCSFEGNSFVVNEDRSMENIGAQ